MAKRKTPEQVIAESNARIAAARLRIAKETSPFVRDILDAIGTLEAISPRFSTLATRGALSDLRDLLESEVSLANSGEERLTDPDASANSAPATGEKT